MTLHSSVNTGEHAGGSAVDGELLAARESARPIQAAPRSLPFVVGRGSLAYLVLLVVATGVVVAILSWGAGFGAFNQGQLTRVMIYAIAIAGLNIASGYTGLISVGHSAFFGLGAYTTGILIVSAGWRPEQTIPVAFAVCFAAGLLVGLPALRIRGLYLAIATLAFGVAFPELVARFPSLTGGAAGLTVRLRMLHPPLWTGYRLSQHTQWLYWLSAAVLIVVMLVVSNVVRSRYGLAMMAARDNEIAASSCGINLASVKMLSFGLSGALTGLGGSLFAMYLGTLVAEDSFTLLNAIALLTGMVIGGAGTRFGPILGGLAVVYIPYYSSSIGQGQAASVIFGVALIAIVFVAPGGVTGAALRISQRVLRVVPGTPRPYQRTPPASDATPTERPQPHDPPPTDAPEPIEIT
jgi:branched-chain amino acid transport system permease protein